MKEKFYTKAEAIVKLQSGEWDYAISTGEYTLCFTAGMLSCRDWYETCESRAHTFAKGEEPIWKEYVAPFEIPGTEILKIANKTGFTYEALVLGSPKALLQFKLNKDEGLMYFKLSTSTVWKAQKFDYECMTAMWRKVKSQEIES